MQYNSQKSFHKLKDSELLMLTLRAAKTEKEATLALLDYLVEIDSRRLYAAVNACSSLFEYLVKELGFSHPAASERVNTVRLIRAVPPVKEHLETGRLTLTSAAQIQRFVNAEQKVDPKGRAVSASEKEKVVEACLGKSKREVEKTLFEKHSEPARILTQERVRAVTASRSEVKFTVSDDTLEKLKQLKDLTGDQSLEKIFDRALDALLLTEKKKRGVTLKQPAVSERKLKPLINATSFRKSGTQRKTTPLTKAQPPIATENHAAQGPLADKAPARTQTEVKPETKIASANPPSLNSRFIPIDLKRFVFARSKGQGEYVDPRTKAR